jgi:hypothetical protein
MKWAGHVVRMADVRMYTEFNGTSQERGPLGISRFRWEDNIKIGIHELRCEVIDTIRLS